MGSKACVTRLQKEYRAILKDPAPQITAHPAPNNLLEWHYVLEGSVGTDFEGGCYHGKVTFPPQYPFKPPSIVMLTPNGRFATNTKLCLSMSDFHPESWNPMWSVSTILTGLLSFMVETQHTTGAISSSPEEKRRFAREALAYNVRNPTFRKLFPEWVKKHELQQAAAAAAAQQQAQQQQAQQQAQQQQQLQQQHHGGAAAGEGQAQGGAAAGGAAGERRARGLVEQDAALQAPQWSNYLVGAAAVAAAGVAATLLMKPPDGA
ncbi:hypothetical protein ABPG75_000646 [Micractinium tetrahymenae]